MAGRRKGAEIGAYITGEHQQRTEKPAHAGDVIYGARTAERITQSALAERAGIGRAMLAQLERGLKPVTPRQWKQISAALPALADAPVRIKVVNQWARASGYLGRGDAYMELVETADA